MVKIKRGLFRPAKNRAIAKIISIKDPRSARLSVKKLKQLYKQGKVPRGKMIQYVNCAEQRALAQLKRRNLSKKERIEMKKVAQIYHRFKEWLKKRKG
jgi:hypothetical protein